MIITKNSKKGGRVAIEEWIVELALIK